MSGSWLDAPVVFVTAAACPFCGATRPATIRSAANGDGSTTRLSTCRNCSQRFKVVVELPSDIQKMESLRTAARKIER